jgi:hypothetical protein
MLIPVNVNQKHWVLACIDFDEKRISWYDSVGNDHPTNSGILFKWLHNVHSSSADPYNIGIANWRVDLGPPPATEFRLFIANANGTFFGMSESLEASTRR